MASHDESYKLLFSHAEMVRDLLQGFVHEEWVQHVDFSTLEHVGGSFVADDLREREADSIWRMRWGTGWLYVYLLIEFQSTIDGFMGVRIVGYKALLYQDLMRSGQVPRGAKLPPVVPVVLYNGASRWTAPTDIAELVDVHPAGLEAYRPHQRYLVLDEGHLIADGLPELQNLAAALFRLEHSRGPEELMAVLTALVGWLCTPEQESLRRAFTVWLKQVYLPHKLPAVELPPTHNLQEVKTMLAEHLQPWTEQWKQQGMQQGMQRGMQQGEVAVLLRLAERRFGPVPTALRARLEAADAETLLRWGENLLDAASLDEIFD